MPCRRTAFTRFDMLAVIVILGILVSMILVALIRTRAVSRTELCANNLRKIGNALLDYEERFKRLPPALTQDTEFIDQYDQLAPQDTRYWFSWMAYILPDLQRDDIYDKIQWYEPVWPEPNEFEPGKEYVNSIPIDIFQCPSDRRVRKFGTAGEQLRNNRFSKVDVALTSYLGVNGTNQFAGDGMLYVNSRVRLTDVGDGTSNTIMVGERPPGYDLVGGWWLAGSGVPPWFGAPDVVCGSNEVIAVDDGVDYQSRPDGPTSYYHPGDFSNKSDGYFWYEHGWHFWSGHKGGANFLFADGSVHFLKYSMGPGPLNENPDLFRELATRAGGEVIGDLEDNF